MSNTRHRGLTAATALAAVLTLGACAGGGNSTKMAAGPASTMADSSSSSSAAAMMSPTSTVMVGGDEWRHVTVAVKVPASTTERARGDGN